MYYGKKRPQFLKYCWLGLEGTRPGQWPIFISHSQKKKAPVINVDHDRFGWIARKRPAGSYGKLLGVHFQLRFVLRFVRPKRFPEKAEDRHP
jgi:hypothetical protein